jgi:L-threonylcarbamoyladenylate synthase
VVAELGPAVDLVVDGGPCVVGVESTVVEVGPGVGGAGTASDVTILRPGGVGAEDLEDALGRPVSRIASGPARAPGMLESHYAPRTPLLLCEEDEAAAKVTEFVRSGRRVGLLSLDSLGDCGAFLARDARGDVALFARSLYGWLREADAASLDLLVAVPPVPQGLGAAIRDRLARAAHG